MSRKLICASLALFAIAASRIGQAPVFGPEFQVNTTTTKLSGHLLGRQRRPALQFRRRLELGRAGRRPTPARSAAFSLGGDASRGEFAVNVSTTGYQDRALVGSTAAGNFVVAWTEFVSTTTRRMRFARGGSIPRDAPGRRHRRQHVHDRNTGRVARGAGSAGNFVVVGPAPPTS